MPTQNVSLIKKELIANNTMAFYFTKPANFDYQAGQYADFTLINPSEADEAGNKRTFSFANAPYENELMIATRMRDTAFKRVLKNLPEGSELELDGPYGSFALPKDPATPVVFLSGGIGCTFVRSMIKQAAHDGMQHKMTFLYSNPTPQDAGFFNEFSELAAHNNNVTFVPTITDSQPNDWTGERGMIDLSMLERHVDNLTDAVYYLSGPIPMVSDLRKILANAGVNKFNIRLDNFIGY